MKAWLVVAMALVFPATALAQVQPAKPAAAPSKDEEAVRAMVQSFSDGWNLRDPARVAAHWADDGTLVNPYGDVAKGPAEIKEMFAGDPKVTAPDASAKIELSYLRMLKPDLALVDIDVDAAETHRPVFEPGRANHWTGIAIRKGTKWQFLEIRVYQFASDAAPAAAPTPDAGKKKRK